MSGIGHLHHKKIIHRDIKLENILLDKNHTKVVIADFGLSNFWNPGAKLQTRCGSAEYAAPEIYNKAVTYCQAVDMWSLGVCLYSMLTGRLPFEVEDDSRHQLLIAVIKEGLTSQLIAGLGAVSEDVKMLLSRLLTVPPGLRITAEEAAGSPWLTSEGALATVDFSPFKEWSAASQLALAGQVRDRLGSPT